MHPWILSNRRAWATQLFLPRPHLLAFILGINRGDENKEIPASNAVCKIDSHGITSGRIKSTFCPTLGINKENNTSNLAYLLSCSVKVVEHTNNKIINIK